MMTKISALLLAALSAVGSLRALEPVTMMIPADSPLVAYEGRYASGSSHDVRFGFPGLTAHVRFRGRTLAMRASASNDDLYFDVEIDGAAAVPLRIAKGEAIYPLLHGETVAEHTLVLTWRNESWQGTGSIAAFDPGADGEMLPAPALPERKLMFIGDSVTCGEMTAYVPGQPMQQHINCNARIAYGKILARKFNAQCALVSYGGRGIIRDWQGIRKTTNAPQFYEMALPDEAGSTWDPAKYVPDAIGIQLGTNDFSSGIPDETDFVSAYIEFIRVVRRDAPNALIFLMDSPIVDDSAERGPRRTVLHAYLEEIVRRVASPKVILAPVSNYPGIPGNGHPSGKEHEAIAAEVAPVLQRAMGW